MKIVSGHLLWVESSYLRLSSPKFRFHFINGILQKNVRPCGGERET